MNKNNSIIVKNKGSSGDVFRTPHFVSRAINKYFDLSGEWCDPCPGEFGDITKALKKEGVNIYDGEGDMFKKDFDENILTNPPFSAIDEFMQYFFNQNNVKKIILFLPNEYETVGKRRVYFYKHMVKKMAFTNRMNITEWRGGEYADFGAVSYSVFEFDKYHEGEGRYEGVYFDNSKNQYRAKHGGGVSATTA